MPTTVAANLTRVRDRVAEACHRCGRDPRVGASLRAAPPAPRDLEETTVDTSALAARLDEAEDLRAIANLKAHYCWLLDTRRTAEAAAAMAPGSRPNCACRRSD